MAGSFLHRAMVQLGLVDDDEYDDYEMYEEPAAVAPGPGPRQRVADPDMSPAMSGQVRALPRNDRDYDNGGVTLQTPRPSVVRPVARAPQPPQVVNPKGFDDAKEIGERLKSAIPVIVNLQDIEMDLQRRLIDFCSGAAFVAGAKMSKVAKHVFLLTPNNVEVSEDDMRRLQERGLYTPKA